MAEYPTDEELDRVKAWGGGDLRKCFAFIRSIWWMPDWGWHEATVTDNFDRLVTRYSISTGGWSGNESIIGAMQENFVLMAMTWQQSRRGGHYVFELVDEPAQAPQVPDRKAVQG